jgi:serine/threonine protein kinase
VTTLTGRTLAGRYRVDALIGRGGMADVYRGADEVLGRPVAIKILTGRDERERERFLKEARAMAQLNHRAIVAVYDAGVEGDWSYIVMELVDGRTLAAIPASQLTVHSALRHYIEIVEALGYAHERGLIHRDVKPSNVMVLPSGTVKVMDFGLARNASEMSSVTNAGEIVGTIAYLPPERFLGKPADERGDLYSVGIMLYETFTGTLPFKSDTEDLVAVIFGHVNEPPPLPRSINRAVPPQVERIVMKLLEKEPDRRYQSAGQLVAALQSLIGPAAPVPADPALHQPPSAGGERATPPSKAEVDARAMLDKTFGKSRAVDLGYSETLAGMLATRKRDYPEALRAYRAALAAFTEARNEIECAKTAVKYGAMILQKNSESDFGDRHELADGVDTVTDALPAFRGRKMLKELEEGERLLYALQRLLIRNR